MCFIMSSTSTIIVAVISLLSIIVAPSYGKELCLPGQIVTVGMIPYDDNGKINFPMISQLANYYAAQNLKNIKIMEFDGDGALLCLPEKKAVAEEWNKQALKYGLNIIVEIGLMSVEKSLSLARFCSKLEAVKAFKYFPEYIYVAETVEEAINDFKRIAKAAPNISLILGEINWPIVSTDEVFRAGDQVSTFVGVETSMNKYLDYFAENSTKNKTIWIYDIQYMYTALINGLTSNTLGPNLFPSTVIAMEAAAKNCDRRKAKHLQEKLNSWIAAIVDLDGRPLNTYARTYYTNIKAAFKAITGMDVGVRAPFVKANSTVYNQIVSKLRALGVPLAESA